MVDIIMFADMCVSLTIAYMIVFGGLGYLIRRFAKGRVQIVLYAILGVLVVFETVLFCVFLESGAKYSSIVALLVSLLLFVTNKFPKSITPNANKKHGLISTLKGYHVYGLSANEGVRVSADLYKDRVVFRSGNYEIESIDKTDIISASSRSEQEVTGSTTVGKQRAGVASTVALMSGDFAAAYFLRPKTTNYKTKNTVKRYWYLVIDTSTISVILQVKSRSSLYYFVDMCNDMLNQSEADYEEEIGQTQIDIDTMSGTDFEHFCADLLRINGYTNVRVTSGSGDQSIDILADKDDMKWAFQCKRWGQETHVGNDVVQKTFAGKAFYHCDIAVVITTSTFTRKAEEYARETGVLLWGRDKLYKLMEKMNDTAHRQ